MLLTVLNVGVDNFSSLPSSVSRAEAAVPTGAISVGGLEGGPGSGVPIPVSSACIHASCTSVGGSGGGGGGVGVSLPSNMKTTFYPCSNVDGAGNCNVNNIMTRDAEIWTSHCQWQLSRWGADVAYGGDSAVAYLKSAGWGAIWNPWGGSENMFSHLTGVDTMQSWFGVAWSDWTQLNDQYYNGNQTDYWSNEYHWYCQKIADVSRSNTSTNTTCTPVNDGRPFTYSVGYYVTYINNKPLLSDMGIPQKDWTISSQTCVYVGAATPPPKLATTSKVCYWNINHSGYFSTNLSAINAGGTRTSNQPVSPFQGAVQPTISGSNSTARLNNCTEQIRMDASLSLEDGYAYYRLQAAADYQSYQYYIWDTSFTGGQSLLADIQLSGSGVASRKVYGTNSCQNGGTTWKQYPSWGSLPNMTFDYSDCGRNVEWTCKTQAPQINDVSNNIEVMRDGSYLPLNLGGVTLRGAGVSAVDDQNMSYMIKLVPGSSPFNATDINGTKQYFQLWKGDKATVTPWDTWVSQPNANKNSFLSFYWSSDVGSNWSFTYQAKLNSAQFSVPFQDSTTSPPYLKWMTSTNVDCDGVKTSNSATVLRSVSSK